MFRALTTNFTRFNRGIVLLNRREALKPNSSFLRTPFILKHYLKCFSTADQRWKHGQYNKDIDDESSSILCISPFSLTANSKRQISTNDIRKRAVDVISSLKNLKDAPIPALAIGAAVLSPVVLPTVYMVSAGVCSPSLSFFQMSYTAALLSFHGGSQWGLLLCKADGCNMDWVNFAHIAMPPLAAGAALMLPTPFSTLVLMGGLTGSTYYGSKLSGYPPWFRAMWLLLGVGAIVSIATAMACRLYLKPDLTETQNMDTCVSKVSKNDTTLKSANDTVNSQCTHESVIFIPEKGTDISKPTTESDDSECGVIPSCCIVPK